MQTTEHGFQRTASHLKRPVRQLSADVARKIAAGEVIDRPQAIVRELMDNAIDSGADRISVEITGGGIERIRVADNGDGMTKEDLAACARPHATSKIIDADDLMQLSTLGFRGEALASIAACARLSIASGTWKMRASLTEDHLLEQIPPVQNGRGTIVQSEGLFENFPARRRFLKRESTETKLCRETFIEKALARTDIAFRLTVDGALRADLPAGVSRAERLCRALELSEAPELFYELKAEETDWRFTLVIGEPGVFRTDRKQLLIYVNGRRISGGKGPEYSLLQAIEYGAQGFFPNGVHPVAALFVEMDPSLVDFNIHPAKREVRFKDGSALHHGVSSTVRDFFRSYGIKESRLEPPQKRSEPAQATDTTALATLALGYAEAGSDRQNTLADNAERESESALDSPRTAETAFPLASPRTFDAATLNHDRHSSALRERFLGYDQPTTNHYAIRHGKEASERSQTEGRFIADIIDRSRTLPVSEIEAPLYKPNYLDAADEDGFRFIGSALGTFLIAEQDATLYFIDQHAAHERLLFDQLMQGTAEKQTLLIPYELTTESEEDECYLERIAPTLAPIGFTARACGNGRWEFSTIPARWTGTEQDLRDVLLEKHESADKLMYAVCAMTACKAAVKDGFVLDWETAAQLAKDALALSDPHCPHGRPVWTTLSREQLFARVRRT
mgnify:FL=1